MLQIGTIIQRHRKQLNITQETLATHCQVSKASVSKWEKGQSYPDITLLPKLAAYFDITVDDLLSHQTELSKQQIQDIYNTFSKRFAKEPYNQVFADVEHQVKLSYHNAALLLQMSVLMLNYQEIAPNSQTLFITLHEWLERIRRITDDVWVLRQVNSLQATIAIMQAQPEKTLDLLEGAIQPNLGDETLLATAYQQLGQTEKATRVTQAMMFQHVILLVGGSAMYLHLIAKDKNAVEKTINRSNVIIDTYDLHQLHPNVCLQFYISVAQHAATTQNRSMLYDYLAKFVDICTHHLFPIELRADDYFNLLDDWLEQLDLGKNAIRNDTIIKQSLIDTLNAPFFTPYALDEQMHNIKDKLRFGLEAIQ